VVPAVALDENMLVPATRGRSRRYIVAVTLSRGEPGTGEAFAGSQRGAVTHRPPWIAGRLPFSDVGRQS